MRIFALVVMSLLIGGSVRAQGFIPASEIEKLKPTFKQTVETFQNRAGSLENRQKAARALGDYVSNGNSSAAIAALKGVAENSSEHVDLRADSIAALHWASGNNVAVRRAMIGWAQGSDAEIRLAAIRALGSASQEKEAASLLKAVFIDKSEPYKVREAALTSLYFVADQDDIWRTAFDAAINGEEDEDVRAWSTLFLSGGITVKVSVADIKKLSDGPTCGPTCRSAVLARYETGNGRIKSMSRLLDFAQLKKNALTALDESQSAMMRYKFKSRYDPILHVAGARLPVIVE